MPRHIIRSQHDTQHYRIIDILSTLDDEGEVDLQRLADKYEVTLRTIKRDFQAIEACGYEIENTQEPGKKRYAPGFSLYKAKPSSSQQAALIMVNSVAKNLGSAIQKPLETLFERLTGKKPAGRPDETVPIMPTNKRMDNFDEEILDVITSAIRQCFRIDITYAPPDKPGTIERCICPLKLLVAEGSTYVLAMPDLKRGSLIKYRLDRIQKCKLTGMPEEKEPVKKKWRPWQRGKHSRSYDEMQKLTPHLKRFEPLPGLDKILEKSHSIWGVALEKDRKIQVKLLVKGYALEYFKNQELMADQKVTIQDDGSLIFEAKIADNREVIPHILRWVPHVTVIAPDELKAEITKTIQTYVTN